jgi:hypothetical protein
MFRRLIDFSQYLEQIKYVYGGAVFIAVALGGYMVLTTAAGFVEAARTERAVQSRRAEYLRLAAQSKHGLNREIVLRSRGESGVEAFAVQMASLARSHDVSIESLSPEGGEGSQDVVFNNASLGQWEVDLVTVRGRGQFDQVMAVLEALGSRAAPLRVESYSLQ